MMVNVFREKAPSQLIIVYFVILKNVTTKFDYYKKSMSTTTANGDQDYGVTSVWWRLAGLGPLSRPDRTVERYWICAGCLFWRWNIHFVKRRKNTIITSMTKSFAPSIGSCNLAVMSLRCVVHGKVRRHTFTVQTHPGTL